MATLRSALRHLAPAARFVRKGGGRSNSEPIFTAVRRKHSTGVGVFYSTILWDETFDLLQENAGDLVCNHGHRHRSYLQGKGADD
ncbi:hypothetical protein D1007_14611 [Hordeum vulgare]|nr:hypothetical protein D1007_14611 [Hordeum vulgare]